MNESPAAEPVVTAADTDEAQEASTRFGRLRERTSEPELFISGLLASLVWFALVGRVGAVRASSFHYLEPFYGLVIAAMLLGEKIGVWDVVGVIVVAMGIVAVQRSKRA